MLLFEDQGTDGGWEEENNLRQLVQQLRSCSVMMSFLDTEATGVPSPDDVNQSYSDSAVEPLAIAINGNAENGVNGSCFHKQLND